MKLCTKDLKKYLKENKGKISIENIRDFFNKLNIPLKFMNDNKILH